MRWRAFLYLLILSLEAVSAVNQAAQGLVIDEIHLTGLSRTEPEVVYRELLFAEGDVLDQQDFEESVQRLKNLRIFSDVSPQIAVSEKSRVTITKKMEEKWTTIPIFKLASGGNTTHVTVGVYDINAFGKYIELGGQYENLNRQSSGVLWFRNPRFMGRRLRLGMDTWSVRRPQSLYTAAGIEQTSYVLERQKINLFLDREFQHWFTFGGGLEFNKDSFLQQASDTPLENVTGDQFDLSDEQETTLFRLYSRVGRLNYENYLVDGLSSELTLESAFQDVASDTGFTRVTWDNQFFKILPLQSNFATRFRVGINNSTNLQHQFFIGGLEHIRGYLDGQFRGQAYWQLNTEYRISSFHHRWFVLQHNFFFDVGQIAEKTSSIDSNMPLYSSYGFGIRLLSPKVYRLNVRLDFAFTNSATEAGAISFGAQQFF